ncbi:SMP-30/gluconolactonase/LRE family protein [Bacillus sp. FJAT-44742]|uniref:SMP-30/gluconolactonase/LRE family protein n=1 Tax=Bacillus sp. FJAT-44742 TaxID=2014005 RepID=UPI0012FEE54F|nr:SMP-30/gluconolactonase/LRE family protein [Bacillus sp. FJAT-44742]
MREREVDAQVIAHYSELGESPIWDDEKKKAYWVDITGERIHEYDPENGKVRSIKTGQMVGAVAPTSQGKLVAAMQHGFYIVDMENHNFHFLSDPEEEKANNRFNDGKCDTEGRFWAGTISLTRETGAAALYCLNERRKVRKMHSPVTVSNGLAWNRDRNCMYYIDTPEQQVVVFNYEFQTGDIFTPRPVIDFTEEKGKPDGMTIDSEGKLWIAHFEGGKVSRWDPDTGEKQEEINLPASLVTSCTFGGKDLNQLFVTTADVKLTEKEKKEQPMAGFTFVITLADVTGLPPNRYQGA